MGSEEVTGLLLDWSKGDPAAGLTVEETAEVLKVSTDTVKRDWRLAKTWLLRELSQGLTHEPSGQP